MKNNSYNKNEIFPRVENVNGNNYIYGMWMYKYPVVYEFLKQKVGGKTISSFFERENYKNIVIYSITDLSELVINDLRTYPGNVHIKYICDLKSEEYNNEYLSIKIKSVDYLKKDYFSGIIDCILVCNIMHECEIISTLMECGIEQESIITISRLVFYM